jgi:hypothetical protein
MKLPDVYGDWRVVLGIAVMLLGTGNWIVGRVKAGEYMHIIASQPDTTADQAYRSFDELDAGSNAVLEPFTAEQQRHSYATARMDFYHATFLTGYLLVMAGLVLTCIGFLGVIRRDARRVVGRINLRSGVASLKD